MDIKIMGVSIMARAKSHFVHVRYSYKRPSSDEVLGDSIIISSFDKQQQATKFAYWLKTKYLKSQTLRKLLELDVDFPKNEKEFWKVYQKMHNEIARIYVP